MPKLNSLTKLVAATLAAGVVSAFALSPVATFGAVAVDHTNETMQANMADIASGSVPGVTTITDKNDDPIAWVYKQRRFEVPSEAIAQSVKQAIVSIEDRRFYEHKGVDIQGNFRAIAANLVAGDVAQGASTLDQQYVKNYLLLVTSDNTEEQAAAIETSIPRKLREMRMASQIDATLSKDEILTRYLNLIPFGNGAYGIEAAAQTYFGIPAKDLSVGQSAMLAGMVQSSSYLNPYTNEEGVIERRNAVLDAMVSTGTLPAQEAQEIKKTPLDVLPEPKSLPNGCITAGNNGFFCDYVLQYLAGKGFGEKELTAGSYHVKTTLDPEVQQGAEEATASQVSPTADGVANVTNIIEPGTDSRRILAMASSRQYGLDTENYQTVFPQTASLVGNGAGSIFKIFTAAAALEKGYGLNTRLAVPSRYEAQGMGAGGAANCPANTYCVENSGSYASQMTLQDALAYSPNTTFVQLIEEVGVPTVVDLSVKLGLRSYQEPGSYDQETSIADYFKENNLGSYTLGPTAVNPLELSNVGATLASEGVWCEPNPIDSITDSNGNEIYIERPACEKAVDEKIANTLLKGMSKDAQVGTAKDAAAAAGWRTPVAAKTGTTESHQSAAFLGMNSVFAAATYIYNDGTSVASLCTSPARQCSSGSMYGGDEPAQTWFAEAEATGAQAGTIPAGDRRTVEGASASLSGDVRGKTVEAARRSLIAQGYKVTTQVAPGDGTPAGRIMSADAPVPLEKGSTVTLYVSDGTVPEPEPAPGAEEFTYPDGGNPVRPPSGLGDLAGDILGGLLG